MAAKEGRSGAKKSSHARRIDLPAAVRPKRRALAFAVGTALVPWSFAHADVAPNTLPSGGQYAYGSGSIAQQGDAKLQITQTTEKGTVNWNSFSIGSSAWVNFTQPSASSVTLNRVLGNNPSEIFGRMTANGQVFLSNPNGVLFAPSANVDVGALFATTLSVSDQDANAGRYTKWINSGNAGGVVNQGTIITADGYTALAAPQVRNDGVILANAGSVTLAAGNSVTLDMIGDGLIKVAVDSAALNASVINAGTIHADGGNVLLTARSANALLDTVVNNSGVIRANSLVEKNGEIVLDGGFMGIVANSGTLNASGADAGTTGGTVKVLGDKVALLGGTWIDVSGDAGGGTALAGGNFHGAGPEGNSTATYVSRDASINADAITSGNGGQVAIWSDGTTRFYGSISARGGAQAGDGGFMEVSGKQNLTFDGYVSAAAPHGQVGTLLLDPNDLYLGQDPTPVVAVDESATPTLFNANDAADHFITAAAIFGAGDVAFDLQAAHDVIFNASITANNIGGNSFAVTAGNAITMNGGTSLTTAGGDIVFNAGGGGMSLQGLDAGGGTITAISSGGNIALGGAITTTNTTASAVLINAGSAAAAGSAAGGEIIVSGGTVSVGAGGTARLFMGSVAGSTGLTGLVGSGSGQFRYNSDEVASNFSVPIGAGAYAIYREQPTLTISADDKGPITYGAATPAYTTSISGLQNGDTAIQALSTPATVADDGMVSTSLNLTAGSHTLTPSGAVDQLGYAISYSTGTLTVDPLALTATAIGASSSTYGSPVVPGAVTFGTVVVGDIVTATATVDATLSTGLHEKAGSWTQSVSTSSLGGADAANYTLGAFTSAANYTISPLALTGVAIAAGSSTYGAPVVPGAVSFGNVQSGDIVNSAATVDGTLSTGLHENAGTWTQTASTTLTGADAANYTFAGFTSAANYTINQATISNVTGVAGVNKVYDGNTVAPLDTSGASFTGMMSGDALIVATATGAFSDKEVGSGKTVSITGISLGGADVANYTLATTTASSSADITRLGSVSWTGGGGNNLWSNAANWGGAIPDLANVANVNLNGASVVFDSGVTPLSGSVQVDSISNGSLTVSSGTLNTPSMSLTTFTQTGGTIIAPSNLSITATGTLTPGTITVPGSVLLSAGTLLGGGPISANSGTFGSNSNVATLNLTTSFAGKNVLLTGSATSWTLCDAAGCGTSMAPPAFSKTSTDPVDIFFNGVNLGSSATVVSTITGSIGSSVAQIAAQALQDALDTDSVQKQIDYGFAGDVGTTPPMDHRIDETGISTPECFAESREAEPCKR